MRCRSDVGQTSSSYVGMLVVVATIMAAILATDRPAAVAEGLDSAVCLILGRADCGTGEASAGEVADASSTAVERATAGQYVAVGDSFSSGEGAYDYDPGTDTDDNRCHRSGNAYSEQVANDFDFAGGVDVVTCSGARTENVMETGQHGEGPQIEAITEDTSLVTIGVGGNDADWVPVIRSCLIEVDLSPGSGSCQESEDEVLARMKDAADRVLAVYEAARDRAPEDARVIGLGYPRFFPEDPSDTQYDFEALCPVALGGGCIVDIGLEDDEQRWMNELTRRFNDMLADRAEQAGIEFVDLTDAFAGHEFGTDDSYFNGVEGISVSVKAPDCGLPTSLGEAGDCLDSALGDCGAGALDNPGDYLSNCVSVEIAPETFHPNANGQERFGELVSEQIEDP